MCIGQMLGSNMKILGPWYILYFWILSSYFVNLRKSSGPKLGVLSSRENLHLFLPGDKGCSLPGTVLTLQESWFNSGVPDFLPCFGWAQGLASVNDTDTSICLQSKPASPAACYSFCIRIQLNVIFSLPLVISSTFWWAWQTCLL